MNGLPSLLFLEHEEMDGMARKIMNVWGDGVVGSVAICFLICVDIQNR